MEISDENGVDDDVDDIPGGEFAPSLWEEPAAGMSRTRTLWCLIWGMCL